MSQKKSHLYEIEIHHASLIHRASSAGEVGLFLQGQCGCDLKDLHVVCEPKEVRYYRDAAKEDLFATVKPKSRARELACSVCGPGDGASLCRQFYNQDAGFGICTSCAESIVQRDGAEYATNTYGHRYYHWGIPKS